MLDDPPPGTLGTYLMWGAMRATAFVETCRLRLAEATATEPQSQWDVPTDEQLEQEQHDRWEDHGEQQALHWHMEACGFFTDDDDDDGDLLFDPFSP